jgi:hypothetical protein
MDQKDLAATKRVQAIYDEIGNKNDDPLVKAILTSAVVNLLTSRWDV